MNQLIKLSFLKELNKIADAISSYKCPECGFVPGGSEKDQRAYCPKCGASMNNAPGYETRQNS